jgi:hypothetical protein
MVWFRDLYDNLLDRMEVFFFWGEGVTETLCELLRHAMAQLERRMIDSILCHVAILCKFLTQFPLI